jgi:transmembrane sensor
MNDVDWKVVDRYLTGQATAADEARIRAWSDDPAFVELLRQLSQPEAHNTWNVDAAWTAVRSRAAVTPAKRAASRWSARVVAGAAAAVVAAAAIGAGLWGVQRNSPSVAPTMRDIATRNGQRDSITLPDGSRAYLNAGSHLRYQIDATRGERNVFLDGEAMFDVRHEEARPFRVYAKGAIAQDLGTRFTVRAYAELPAVNVAVMEGVVSLHRQSTSDSVVLRPGTVGQLNATGTPRIMQGSDVGQYESWTSGTLVFDRMPLRDAVAQLQRKYDVTIVIADSALANRRLVVRVSNEPLAVMLDVIGVALGARVERDGQRVILTSTQR